MLLTAVLTDEADMLWRFLLVTGALYVLALVISFLVALVVYKRHSHLRHHDHFRIKPV